MPNTTPRPQGQPQGNTPTQSTSTNQTLHLTPMLAKFKAGDSVLCPSLGNDVHTLAQHSDTVNFKHKVYFVGGQGEQQVFRPDGTEYKGGEQVIFHDTPANREAIATLYGVTYDTMPADTNPQAGEPQKAIDAILDALGRLRPHPAQTDHDIAGVIFSLKPLSEQLITATSNTPTHAQAVLLGNCVNRYLAAFTTEEHIDDNQWDELSGDITASVNAVYQSILWGALSCTH